MMMTSTRRNFTKKNEFLFLQYQNFEWCAYWLLLDKLVIKDCHNCLDDHNEDYTVNNNIVKTRKSVVVMDYLSHVS